MASNGCYCFWQCQMGQQDHQGYWSGKAYANFDSFLFMFGDFCKTSGTQMPRQARLI